MKNNQKGFASIILLGAFIALVAIGGYFVFVKKSEPAVLQPITTPAVIEKNIPTEITSKDKTAGWKTYTNEEYGFEFNYPSSWSLTDLYGGLWLKNIDGEQVIQIAFSLRNNNSNDQKTLESYIKSTAGQENSRSGEYAPENIEKIIFEKIIDAKETLGYISQWKIIWADKTSENETRADFESKLEINQTDNYKTVVSFFALKTEQDFDNIDLLKSIASTFKFTK